jgi:hypothetical protein
MRRRIALFIAIGVVSVILVGTVSLARSPNLPPNCIPCGNEFKGVDPQLCGLLFAPVDAYKASGNFVARYSNRCYGCTAKGVYCTVAQDTQ